MLWMVTLILRNHQLVELVSTTNKGCFIVFDFLRKWNEFLEESKRVCNFYALMTGLKSAAADCWYLIISLWLIVLSEG